MQPSQSAPFMSTYPLEPVLKDLFHRTASVSLKFVIVGGSIGGLAAAYNLIQAGHEALVLEASSGKEFVSLNNGIQFAKRG